MGIIANTTSWTESTALFVLPVDFNTSLENGILGGTMGGTISPSAVGVGGGVGGPGPGSGSRLAASLIVPLYTVIFVLSVSGNLLVLATLACNRRMRTVTNVYLLNLALADLLLGLLCVPVTLIGQLLRNFVFGATMCKLIPYCQAVSVSVGVWTLVALSLERYAAICRPLQSRRWQTRRHAYRSLAVVWTAALLWSLPAGAASTLQALSHGRHKCREQWGSAWTEQAYSLFLDGVLLLVPLLVMGVAYSLIVSKLWRRMRHELRHNHHQHQVHHLQIYHQPHYHIPHHNPCSLHHHLLVPNGVYSRGGTVGVGVGAACPRGASPSPRNRLDPVNYSDYQRWSNNCDPCRAAHGCACAHCHSTATTCLACNACPVNTARRTRSPCSGSCCSGVETPPKKRWWHFLLSSLSKIRPSTWCQNGPTVSVTPCSDSDQVSQGPSSNIHSNTSGGGSEDDTDIATGVTMTGITEAEVQSAHPFSRHAIRSNYMDRSIEAKKKVIRMLFVLVLEFFVCWAPLHALNTWHVFRPDQVYNAVGATGVTLVQALAYLSACANPITYCFMNRRFRQAFRAVFRCRAYRTYRAGGSLVRFGNGSPAAAGTAPASVVYLPKSEADILRLDREAEASV